jgi:acyl carrier protein
MKTVDDIVQLMKKAGIRRGKLDSLVPDQPLSGQGLDSYDRMSLLFEIEEMLNEDIPGEVANKLKTLQDVVDYVNRHP